MSLEIPTWDKISGSLGSTTKEFGGDWANLISDYYNAIDIGLLDPSKRPIINTLTRYRNEKLGIFDNDQSHYVILSADDIDTGGVRKIKIRRMNSPFEEDYAVLEGMPQEIINKEIDFDLNTGTNIGSSAIKSDAITTIKILDSNVTLSKLAPDSVNASKIVDGAITNAEISSTAAIDPVKLDRTDKDTTVEKRGRYECMSKWGLDATGMLADMDYVGNLTFSGVGLDASGASHVFGTGTAGANSWAGTYLINAVGSFAGWTRPQHLPHLRFRENLPARSSGDVAFLFGFWTGTDFPATTDGNILTTANGGVMIGWDSDDTNIQLYVGPGDGSTSPSSPVDTTRPVPTASSISRIIDIQFTTSTSVTVKIFDGNTLAELYNSGPITTNLPASTKSLNFLNLIRSPTNVNKNLACYGAWSKAKA